MRLNRTIRQTFIALVILVSATNLTNAQQRFSSGIMPEFKLDYNISERFSIHHGLSHQQQFYNKADDFKSRMVQTEFQNILAYQLSETTKIGGGYLLKIKNHDRYYHRITQQITFKEPIAGLALSHRVRTDQTFSDQNPLFRFRYRAKAKFKFKDEALSPGDHYIMTSIETLYMIQSQADDFENRVNLALGFYLNAVNQLEIGFDWRTDDYLVSGFRNRLWLKASYSYHL